MQTDYADRISYLIIDSLQHQMAQHALNVSQHLFPLTNRIVFSDIEEGWDATKFIQIPKITSIEAYNELLLTEAWKHVETDFIQVIQWDGHVINPKAFRPEFLGVDYIGAVWPHHKTRRIGNGGFSLRSKRLMKVVHSLLTKVPNWQNQPEDELICRTLGEHLESEHNVEFAKGMMAQNYSMEWDFDFGDLPFGFHGMAMLIGNHKNNIAGLLDKLSPVRGWQLHVMGQLISTLTKEDRAAFDGFMQRHDLFDEYTSNLDANINAVL